ncbi:hypothetical protein [Sphingosinicella sp. BN140058]|uniref:hypothetical protein n=1 Tax=Sphingosinicella sp. BN140058 TaxID=1892855 RepID=UPI0010135B17|nr:hypothetical protein [Sphingosinicella sp. BN140058]QAY75093.1 hypothetical protein ETR14_00020 [Sphingosinicella sp. BN140058]
MEADRLADPPVGTRAPGTADTLAHGLMLVRASNLSMVRLQLAFERRDRRSVLERIDDLAGLDRELRDLVRRIPVRQGMHTAIADHLDLEHALLQREKLALTAGVIRRDGDSLAPRLEPARAAQPDAASRPDPIVESVERPIAILIGPEDVAPPDLADAAGPSRGRAAIGIVIALLLVVLAAGLWAAFEADLRGGFSWSSTWWS